MLILDYPILGARVFPATVPQIPFPVSSEHTACRWVITKELNIRITTQNLPSPSQGLALLWFPFSYSGVFCVLRVTGPGLEQSWQWFLDTTLPVDVQDMRLPQITGNQWDNLWKCQWLHQQPGLPSKNATEQSWGLGQPLTHIESLKPYDDF